MVTPDLIFPAAIFESIAAVTAGTVTEENPLYGEVGVTVCAEVVGVIV